MKSGRGIRNSGAQLMKELFLLKNTIKNLRPKACCSGTRRVALLYFHDIVNEFTYFECISLRMKAFNATLICLLPAPPLRPVRRVHIMPLGTPIRRIGKTRKGHLYPDDRELYNEIRYKNRISFPPLNNTIKFYHHFFIMFINHQNQREICFI